MKRYLVFCYCKYYPMGAFNDFRGDYDTLGECLDRIKELNMELYDVLDTDTGEWIYN